METFFKKYGYSEEEIAAVYKNTNGFEKNDKEGGKALELLLDMTGDKFAKITSE
jgi:hypothetical protein